VTSRRDFSTRPVRGASFRERAFLGLAAAAVAVSAALAFQAKRDLGEAQAAVEAARRDPALRRAPALRDAAGTLAAQALATSEAPPARILADLAALMPGDVRLNAATLVYGETVLLELNVAAREDAAYDRFLENLTASPRFGDILPGAESRGGTVTAPLRLRYRPGGAP